MQQVPVTIGFKVVGHVEVSPILIMAWGTCPPYTLPDETVVMPGSLQKGRRVKRKKEASRRYT